MVWVKFYVLLARSVLEVLFVFAKFVSFYCKLVSHWGGSRFLKIKFVMKLYSDSWLCYFVTIFHTVDWGIFHTVLHWGASVHFLTQNCDTIYWLLIILSFLNLKCLRPLFIMLAFYVSFMGVSYFWNLFLMTKCWRISVSRFRADFTSFWWKLMAMLKSFGLMFIVEVWR